MFTSEVKLSVGIELWLQSWVMRIVMSMKTIFHSMDSPIPTPLYGISHTNDISEISNSVDHLHVIDELDSYQLFYLIRNH